MLSGVRSSSTIVFTRDTLSRILLLRRLGLVYESATRFRQLQDVLVLGLAMTYFLGSDEFFKLCTTIFLILSGVSRVALAVGETTWLIYSTYTIFAAVPRLPGWIFNKILEFTLEELYAEEKQETKVVVVNEEKPDRQQLLLDLEKIMERLVKTEVFAEIEIITALTKAHFLHTGIVTLFALRCVTYDRTGRMIMSNNPNAYTRSVSRPVEAHPCYKNMFVSRGRLRLLSREVEDCMICYEPIQDSELATFHGTCGRSLHLYCAQTWHMRGSETCPFDNQRLIQTEY